MHQMGNAGYSGLVNQIDLFGHSLITDTDIRTYDYLNETVSAPDDFLR